MDYLDFRKNYWWADLWIKTKRLEADEIAWDIHATAWSIWTTELADLWVTTWKIAANWVTLAKTTITTNDVTVALWDTTWTATVVAWSVVIWVYAVWNQDQFITDIDITWTTLTVTLWAWATADNVLKVVTIV